MDLKGTTFHLQVDWSRFLAAGVHVDSLWPSASAVGELDHLFTPLLGAHQAANAGTAAVTAIVASHRLPGITPEAVRQGLATVSWPGRLQVISQKPIIIVDGAHTAESAHALSAAIDALFGGKRLVLVVGMAVDKDIPATVGPLAIKASAAVATQSDHPRAAPAEIIESALRAVGAPVVEKHNHPWEAVQRARTLAGEDGVVLVTGSLHVIGAVLGAWTAER